jgi:hypothetical protein
VHIDLSLERGLPRGAGKPPRAPWKGLLDALSGLSDNRGQIIRHSERPWASVTFSGTRHSVALAFNGADAVAAAERFIDALPDHEFAIPRQLVAEAAIVAVDHRLLPEPAMTVECELVLLDDEG